MALFDKLKDFAKSKTIEALDGLKDALNDTPETEENKNVYYEDEVDTQYETDEEVFNEVEDERDEEYEVVEDEEFDELNEMVDHAIENGELDEDDYAELMVQAQKMQINMEEFQQMIDARLRQMQYAINEGHDRNYYYRTRSVWRRCPNCGHLVLVDDDICSWCGYYLHIHPVASAIALGLMAASSKDRQRVKQQRTFRRAAAKKAGIKSGPKKTSSSAKPAAAAWKAEPKRTVTGTPKPAAVGPQKRPLFGGNPSEPKRTVTGTPKPAAVGPQKRPLFGGNPSEPKKKSGLFGSSSPSEPKKKSGLFGSSSPSKSSSTKKKSGGGLFGNGIGLLGGKKRR